MCDHSLCDELSIKAMKSACRPTGRLNTFSSVFWQVPAKSSTPFPTHSLLLADHMGGWGLPGSVSLWHYERHWVGRCLYGDPQAVCPARVSRSATGAGGHPGRSPDGQRLRERPAHLAG